MLTPEEQNALNKTGSRKWCFSKIMRLYYTRLCSIDINDQSANCHNSIELYEFSNPGHNRKFVIRQGRKIFRANTPREAASIICILKKEFARKQYEAASKRLYFEQNN